MILGERSPESQEAVIVPRISGVGPGILPSQVFANPARWPAFLDLPEETVKTGYYQGRGWI
jgi:hypothetical protein